MIRVFAFPFSGGNSFSFRKLNSYLDKNIELIPIDYPGHGARIKEVLLDNITNMVEDIYARQRDLLRGQFALYGHSLGGLLAFLIAGKLSKLGSPSPCHLIISGTPAPNSSFVTKDMHLLPRKAFYEALSTLGCVSEEILQNEELMLFFEPVIKADLRAIDSYCFEASPLFNIPITVMRGTNDQVTIDNARAWENFSTGTFSYIEVHGDHFFVLQNPATVGMELNQILKKYLCGK